VQKKILSKFIIVVLLTLLAGDIPLIRNFGLKSLDRQFHRHADPAAASRKIVLVEVDQASLDHFEQDNIAFPWPRSLYNPIIRYATGAGAKAVLFDILFNNISPYGLAVDEQFAGAIRDSGRVGLAAAFVSRKNATPDAALAERFGVAFEGAAPAALKKNRVSAPLPAILEATAHIGTVIFEPDPDGVYRRVAPGVVYGGRLVPSLFAIPAFAGAATVRFSGEGLALGKRVIPLDKEGRMIINYTGPRGSYPRYPAAAVISSMMQEQMGQTPDIPKEAFKDAVVIVGYTAPGLFDLKPNPLSPVSPGIEIYAAALDTILADRHIRIMDPASLYALAFAGALAVAAGVLLVPYVAGSAAIALIVGWVLLLLCDRAFAGGLWVNLVPLESAALLSLIGAAVWRYQTEGKQKRQIHKAFAHYVSPAVVTQMLAEPGRLGLGGEKRKLTLLFSDLEGFTTLSERLDAHELVSILNEYTTLMADTITSFDGTLDKYIGDAVMAFWGAPLDSDDQAVNACRSALSGLEQLDAMSARLVSEGLTPVNMRIGLNTGECVVGNMGSAARFDYTALGDPVNQAARLEGLNKFYGTRILAAEPTWREVKDEMIGREIDFLKVKGKDEPVRVYEIMAEKGRETPGQARLIERYNQALAAYKERRWDEVIALAGPVLDEVNDGPTRVLLERAQKFMATPPPPDWDGSYKHTSK